MQLDTPNIITFIIGILIIIIGFFYSIILHEIGHGYVAYLFGDDTARRAGRLSLNPVNHIDLVGTIILPVACLIMHLPMFGWAKPVPINPYNFKNMKTGMIFVSLAGITINFFLTALMFFLFSITKIEAILTVASINIMLVVFNIIPLPPLDGYNFFTSILPIKFARLIRTNETTFLVILVILMVTGWIRYIYNPIYNLVANFFLSLFHFGS